MQEKLEKECVCFHICKHFNSLGVIHKRCLNIQGGGGLKFRCCYLDIRRQKLGKSVSKFPIPTWGRGYLQRPKQFRRLLWTAPYKIYISVEQMAFLFVKHSKYVQQSLTDNQSAFQRNTHCSTGYPDTISASSTLGMCTCNYNPFVSMATIRLSIYFPMQ